ncbi:16778_t:CDS:2 [Acaulospora colombiana]|uniref:16778_t:CDS:1 n=1 Tax=Acaulospora colombiana TaxID=27376 RepID=A0ACA9K0H3_9GLOM|nr:16778_t:CDS:2 [Acaulospora colombiana]
MDSETDTDWTTIRGDNESELEVSTRSTTPIKKRARSISSSEDYNNDIGEDSQTSSVGSNPGSSSGGESKKKKKVKSSYVNSKNNNRTTLRKHRKPGSPTRSKRQTKPSTKQSIPIQPARKRGRPAGIKNRTPIQHDIDNGYGKDYDSQIIHRRNSGKLTIIEENDVFAKDNAGQTNLHRACQSCSEENLDMVKALIGGGADVNVRDNAGLTPLHEAVNSQNYEVVKYLLEAGANPNIGESDAVDTPLHDAVNIMHEEIISILIDYGGDPEKTNLSGMTPKMLAADEPEILSLLKSASKVKEPNSLIIQKNTEAKVSEEFRRIPSGETGKILHRKSIPSHSGRPTRSTKMSGRPSDRSRCNDSLRNNGARGITSSNEVLRLDLSIDSKTGRSRLHHYSKLGHAEAVVGILEMDPSIINLPDKPSKRTSLHEASIEGHHEIISFLLAYQANINAQDKYGNTPLHYASFYGHGEVIKLLLEHNTALEIKNEDGKTPLDMARGRRHIIQLICQALGVDSEKYLSNNVITKSESRLEKNNEMQSVSKSTPEPCDDSKKEIGSVNIDVPAVQSKAFSVESEKKSSPCESICNMETDTDLEPIYQESDGDFSCSSLSDTEESQPKTPVLKAGPIYAFQFDPKIEGYPLVPYTGNEDARFVIDIQIEKYLVWDRGSLAKKINQNIARRKVTFDEKRMLWPLLNKELWRDPVPENHLFENIQTKRRSQFDKWELHFIKVLFIMLGPWEGRQIGDLKIFPIDIVSNDGNIDDAEESDG